MTVDEEMIQRGGVTRRNEAEMEEVYPSESPYLPCAVVRREGGDEGKKSGIKDG